MTEAGFEGYILDMYLFAKGNFNEKLRTYFRQEIPIQLPKPSTVSLKLTGVYRQVMALFQQIQLSEPTTVDIKFAGIQRPEISSSLYDGFKMYNKSYRELNG